MPFVLVRLDAVCNTHNFFQLPQGKRRDINQSNKAFVPVVSASHPGIPEVSETVVDPNSLFSLLGGSAAVEAAVNLFCKKVLDDAELTPFFAGISMIDKRAKQVLFLTYVFDGHSAYSSKSIFAAHANIIKGKGLNLTHFGKVAVLLQDTLLDLGVAIDLVEEVGRKVLALQPLFDPVR
eukprot:gene4628-14820_t